MGLSTKQRKAIAALITEPTIEAAAKKAGCASRSIRNWLADNETFQLELAKLETAIIADSARSIAAGSLEAITALREIIKDPAATRKEKKAAANSLLTHLPKLRLLAGIEKKLEKLERDDSLNKLFGG